MFLSFIKDFSVKKILKNSLHNVKSNFVSGRIKTVGLLVDQSYFSETPLLIQELVGKGILEEDITVIVYKDKFKKNKSSVRASFSSSHLNWNSEINNLAVNDFIEKEFDLLISYYDVEKAILLVVTHNSKAHFKVGFAAIDKRFNDMMINTNAENYKAFTHELFRYLKILNKI
ncbi:DUF6913 domain-containing protein [Flavobacterium frigoris]|uniref:Uncharacterized protein n=1 Tax=Flavobacterium frigoris (strain PS1) TaxID=1086011 RepID=H7FRX6_FLAFP|nr:hypothetical protein [Flavobacterium frigoris]EIA08404.1 hypothetical protein HJ01_02126 [Flavobacterium frigoris PS1]